MSFIETPRFPVDIKYGSSSGLDFSTDIVTTGNGVEYRNSNWSLPLFRANAKYDVKLRSTAIEVYEFFVTAKGRFGGFRVKDFWDYTSATNGVGSPTVTDQTIGTGDDAEVDFQLIKTYTQGSATLVRTINKPVSGTLLVEISTTLKTEGIDFSVDYTTGIITFTSPVPSGQVVKAGYEYDVPCRFDVDTMDWDFIKMSSSGADSDIVNFPDIPLVEIRV